MPYGMNENPATKELTTMVANYFEWKGIRISYGADFQSPSPVTLA